MLANFVHGGAGINALACVAGATVTVVDMGAAGDVSDLVEQGHVNALDHEGKKPLFDLEMRLGEGTGGALAMMLIDAAFRVMTEVATFEMAAVSGAER